MDIKWENKLILAAWILMFTFGLSGLLVVLSNGNEYIKKDYFETPNFDNQLNQFIDYLSMFELSGGNKEEIKQSIQITAEEIEEYRYRYGELTDQITNINDQYVSKIQDAQMRNNKEAVDFYTSERDRKIEDITNNFKSDEYVKGKIIKEKEAGIDAYYRDIEQYRPEFLNYKGVFKYYLKDTVTGSVYSNVYGAGTTDGEQSIDNKEYMFIQRYPSSNTTYLSTEGRNRYTNEAIDKELLNSNGHRMFEGYIAVPKASAAENSLLSEYDAFKQSQTIFVIYVAAGIAAFLLSLYIYKKKPMNELMCLEKYQPYYNRIPLDLGFLGFIFTGFITLIALVNGPYFYLHGHLYTFIENLVTNLLIAAVLTSLTFIQGKLLLERIKELAALDVAWRKTLLYRLYHEVKAAFLNRSLGIQTLVLLGIMFASGFGVLVVAIQPQAIVIYLPLFMMITVPALVVMMKRIGYFNLIVKNAGEMAKGNFSSDLPVRGKSPLAELAESLNTLKQGVNLSQREQAKSERLKTELITNVSHDLRTPLTSIISYTELLKTPELSDEDREAYIQIIDRKSKRLKVLIDDLFEASKMASGNIDLVKEKVDLVQLLQQALGEHDETISQSTLQFRVTKPEKPVYAFVDGQKLWRAFDNLIVNILKYALESTRVFISVSTSGNKAVIVFKNVTKYELAENIDELSDRFKRGDTSRHTEGSGLGLAIVKSIVDLHDGRLDIEVDGDLFKITIVLNLATA